MAGVGFILAIAGIILSYVALTQISALTTRVRRLEIELQMERTEMDAEAAPSLAAAVSTPRTSAVPVNAQPVHTVIAAGVAESSLSSVTTSVAEAAGIPLGAGAGGAFDEGILPTRTSPPIAREPRKPLLQPLLERAQSTEEWEALIGGRWMNRVGAAALILGMGFFFKYAVDNNWISEQLRVTIGVLVGLLLLAGAWQTHRRDLSIFAQGLTGAGLAILYLSVYASSNYYHLIPQSIALVAMALVTALAFALALTYGSLAVALLASAGGFLSVPLLGITANTQAGAIGFVLLLDVGILSIVFRRDDWFVLEPIATAATYAIYFGWYAADYTSRDLGLAAVALGMVWTVFFVMDVSRILTVRTTYRDLRHTLGAGNVILSFVGFALLLNGHPAVLGTIALVQATIYFATILATKHTLRNGDLLDARYTLTAILLAVVATPVLFHGFAVPILWSLEALVLLWCGVRWNLLYVWWPAIGLFALASAALSATRGAWQAQHLATFTPLLNLRALAFVVLAGTLAGGSLQLRRLKHARVAAFVSSLQYAWCAAIFLLLTVETNDLFGRRMVGMGYLTTIHLQQQRSLALALIWFAYGLPLVYGGLQRRIFPVLSSGLAVTALAVGLGAGSGLSYDPIEQFTPVFNDRALALGLLIAGLIAHLIWLRRDRGPYPWLGAAANGYRAVILLLGFELVTSEIHDYFRHASGAVSESAGASGAFIELVTLAAVWMLYSFPMVRYGIRNRALTVLLIGLGSMTAATGAGVIASVAFQPSTWFSTAIALRPVVLIALSAGLFLHMRWAREGLKAFPWLDTVLIAMQACTVLLGFELITAQTRDVFDNQTQNASASTINSLRNLEQLVLSVLWLGYGIILLGFGLWRRIRWIRLGGLATMAFAMLKIVAYDLSFLNPAYRSLSFVGLGVVMLAASYLYGRYRNLLMEGA